MILENDDYIMVKQAFIDTRLIDQTSILIENDVLWTLQFMYWVNNCGVNAYDFSTVTNANPPYTAPDGLPFVLIDVPPGSDPTYYDTAMFPIVEDFTINIPKGTYERSYLAEFITRQLQSINQPARQSYNHNAFSNNRIIPQHDPSGNGIGFSKGTIGLKPPVITPFLRPVFFGYSQNRTIEFTDSMIYTDYLGQYRQGLFWPLTDNTGYRVVRNNLLLNLNWDQTLAGTITVTTNPGPTGFDIYNAGYIGASEMAFVYNDANGDNRFSFQYMHTPLMNNGNEVVGTYIDNTLQLNGAANITLSQSVFMNAYSGIMLVNTYTNQSDDPKNDPFLQQLGFSYNDLVSPNINHLFNASNRPIIDASTTPLSYQNDFLKYTTRNVMTLGDIVGSSSQQMAGTFGDAFQIDSNASLFTLPPKDTTQYNFQQSMITSGLVASNTPTASNTSAGHYLVELQCAYVSEYVNQEKNYQVKAIIGNYFLSGDSFCMSMGPDSFMHQHQGVPLAISSVKVRLLNPVTKEPADNLGANSTIYLQVTKEKPQPPPQPTETKHETK